MADDDWVVLESEAELPDLVLGGAPFCCKMRRYGEPERPTVDRAIARVLDDDGEAPCATWDERLHGLRVSELTTAWLDRWPSAELAQLCDATTVVFEADTAYAMRRPSRPCRPDDPRDPVIRCIRDNLAIRAQRTPIVWPAETDV